MTPAELAREREAARRRAEARRAAEPTHVPLPRAVMGGNLFLPTTAQRKKMRLADDYLEPRILEREG